MDIHGRDEDNAVTSFELLDRDHEPRQFLNTVWQNKDHVLHSDIAALFHILKGSENIPDEKITAVLAILGKEIQESVDRLREGVANHVSVFEVQAQACPTISTLRSEKLVTLQAVHRAPLDVDPENDLAKNWFGTSVTEVVCSRRFNCFVCIVAVLDVAAFVPKIFMEDCTNAKLDLACPMWTYYAEFVIFGVALLVIMVGYGSLQLTIVTMVLKQPRSVYVLFVSVISQVFMAHLNWVVIGSRVWLNVPKFLFSAMLYSLVSLSDALPSKLRLIFLRFVGPVVLILCAQVFVTLSLPSSKTIPGLQLLAVLGVDTITNVDLIARTTLVLGLLLVKGVFNSWRKPQQLAFLACPLLFQNVQPAPKKRPQQNNVSTLSMALAFI